MNDELLSRLGQNFRYIATTAMIEGRFDSA